MGSSSVRVHGAATTPRALRPCDGGEPFRGQLPARTVPALEGIAEEPARPPTPCLVGGAVAAGRAWREGVCEARPRTRGGEAGAGGGVRTGPRGT